MLELLLAEYLQDQFRDWDDSFEYSLFREDEAVTVCFSKIFSQQADKEIRFTLIDGTLHFTDLSEGYQSLREERDNKFFWINLLCEV